MVTIGTLLDYLKKQHVLGDIEYCGTSDALHVELKGLNTCAKARAYELACVFDKNLYPALASVEAALLILPFDAPNTAKVPKLLVKNPYLAYAYASQLFVEQPFKRGVESSAVVATSARIDDQAYVGPYVVIEEEVVIERGVYIAAHCFIGRGSRIAKNSLLHPRVSVYAQVTIGERCIIHSGAVIGSDGFGFAPQVGELAWQKIAQLGSVEIGNDVEIGANTTIDRGAIENTIIGNGVIIDNQVQIAHNVQIGDNTAIAGCVGIAGSSIIGKNCRLAGGVGLAGHLQITDHVTITGMSMVSKSIKEPGSYSCGTPLQKSAVWRKNAARFAQLDKMFRSKNSKHTYTKDE